MFFAFRENAVYYHLRALRIDEVKEILGSLIFIERRSRRGAGQMELLLRDYYMAVSVVAHVFLLLIERSKSRYYSACPALGKR